MKKKSIILAAVVNNIGYIQKIDINEDIIQQSKIQEIEGIDSLDLEIKVLEKIQKMSDDIFVSIYTYSHYENRLDVLKKSLYESFCFTTKKVHIFDESFHYTKKKIPVNKEQQDKKERFLKLVQELFLRIQFLDLRELDPKQYRNFRKLRDNTTEEEMNKRIEKDLIKIKKDPLKYFMYNTVQNLLNSITKK